MKIDGYGNVEFGFSRPESPSAPVARTLATFHDSALAYAGPPPWRRSDIYRHVVLAATANGAERIRVDLRPNIPRVPTMAAQIDGERAPAILVNTTGAAGGMVMEGPLLRAFVTEMHNLANRDRYRQMGADVRAGEYQRIADQYRFDAPRTPDEGHCLAILNQPQSGPQSLSLLHEFGLGAALYVVDVERAEHRLQASVDDVAKECNPASPESVWPLKPLQDFPTYLQSMVASGHARLYAQNYRAMRAPWQAT